MDLNKFFDLDEVHFSQYDSISMKSDLTKYDLRPIIDAQVKYYINQQILKSALNGNKSIKLTINDFIDNTLYDYFKLHIVNLIRKVFETYHITITKNEILISWENIEPKVEYCFYNIPNDLLASEASMISYVQTDNTLLELKTKVFHGVLKYINLSNKYQKLLHFPPVIELKLLYYVIDDLNDDEWFKTAFNESIFNGHIDDMKYAFRLPIFYDLSQYLKDSFQINSLEPNTLSLQLNMLH